MFKAIKKLFSKKEEINSEKSSAMLHLIKENDQIREEIARRSNDVYQLKEDIQILEKRIDDKNYQISELEEKLILQKGSSFIKINELKKNIEVLFQALGIKETGFNIPVIQIYNKELINKIFENLRETEC